MKEENAIADIVIATAIKLHRVLGPGLLESVYESCLVADLIEQGLKVEYQKALPVVYNGRKLESGYRIDIIVQDKVILEIKAVDELAPIHTAQLLTYLRLSKIKLGFILNFNTTKLTDGIRRYIMTPRNPETVQT